MQLRYTLLSIPLLSSICVGQPSHYATKGGGGGEQFPHRTEQLRWQLQSLANYSANKVAFLIKPPKIIYGTTYFKLLSSELQLLI